MDTPTRISSLGDWAARLAAPVPDPGGGAAAAVVAGIGAAVAAMADGYATDGRADAPLFERVRAAAWSVADRDARASADLAEVYRAAPEGRDPERTRRILEDAAKSSVAVTALVVDLRAALERLAERSPEPVRPDVAVAARLLAAAARAGAINIRVNTVGCEHAGSAPEIVAELRAGEGRAIEIADALDRLAAEVTKTL